MTDWASDGGGLDETGTDNRVSLIRYSEGALVRKTLAELRAAASASAVAGK